MARKVSFSGKNLTLNEVADFYRDTESALRQYYSPNSNTFEIRFFDYALHTVELELMHRLDELDRSTILTVLAALEARFRIDYEIRRLRTRKDAVSVDLRALYRERGNRASLEDDILSIWQRNLSGGTKLIGELRGAFKLRHWLAHGRYWTPKLGRQYDFLSIYDLASLTLERLPLLAGD